MAAPQENALDVYRRLLNYARPYWLVFIPAVIGILMVAAAEPGKAMLLKEMVDGSLIEQDPERMLQLPLMLVGLFVFLGAGTVISRYFLNAVGRHVIADLRRDLFDKLLVLPVAYYDASSSGTLTSKLIYNVEQVANAVTNSLMVLFRDSLVVLALVGFLFWTHPLLATALFVMGPIMALVVVYVSRRFRRISHKIQHSIGEVSHRAGETIEGHRVVRSFGGEAFERQRFHEINELNRTQHMKLVLTDALSTPIIQIVAVLALSAVIYFASLEVSAGVFSAGDFMAFAGAMAMLLTPIKRLTRVNASIMAAVAAAESIFEMLDEPAEADQGSHRVERARGEVSLRGVQMSYPGADRPVLQDIQLEVAAGETVALVGRSGSGKTTLVNLIPRFYEADAGEILLDGVPVADYALSNLRRQVALVSQGVTLFDESVRDNVAYGEASQFDDETIWAALRAAHAADFVRALPNGLDTQIGEHGTTLSGGQRQRLAIARAVLRDAPVLILDEATSALDTESERHIQAALDELMENRTTLVIAHRLSTIEKADRIVVLDQGRIVEVGSHAELLARDGEYANLHRLQFQDAQPVTPESLG